MSLRLGQVVLNRPATIAVHDDGDVSGQVPGIDKLLLDEGVFLGIQCKGSFERAGTEVGKVALRRQPEPEKLGATGLNVQLVLWFHKPCLTWSPSNLTLTILPSILPPSNTYR